ncbi:MAG: hypothetical protein ACK4NC_07405, partial [Candidatus Gracilibacteria bacterium]
MATRVKYEDLFDPELFKKLEDNLESIKKKADEVAKKILDNIVKITSSSGLTNFKDVINTYKELNKEVSKLQKAVDFSQKYQKELARLQSINKELADSVGELSKGLEDNVQQFQLAKVALKDYLGETKAAAESSFALKKAQEDLTKALSSSFTSYDDLVGTLETLRLVYKNAASSNKEFVDGLGLSTRELEKIVAKLDKRVKDIDERVGQFQRNVGAYKEKVIESFVAIGGTVTEELGASSDEVSKFESVMLAAMQSASAAALSGVGAFNKLTLAVKAFTRTTLILGAITLAFEGLQWVIRKLIGAGEDLNKLFKEIDVSLYSNIRLIDNYIFLLNKQASIQQQLLELDKRDSIATAREKLALNVALLKTQRDLLNLELEALYRKRDLLYEERRKANNDERLAEINQELIQVERQLADLNVKRLELLIKVNEETKNYNDFVQGLIDRIKEFSRVSEDNIDTLLQNYKDALQEIKKTANELLQAVAGDVVLTGKVYVAYAKQVEAAKNKVKAELLSLIKANKDFADSILAQNELFNVFVLNISRVNIQIEDLRKRIEELNKIGNVARQLGFSEFAREVEQAVERTNQAIEMLRQGTGEMVEETIKGLKDMLAGARVDYLNEEERFINDITSKRDALLQDLLTKQAEILKLLTSQNLDTELRKELEAISKEIEDTIKFILENFNKRLDEGIQEIRDRERKREQDYFLSLLETFYETDRLAILQQKQIALERAKGLEEREQIEMEYNRRLLDLQKKFLEDQIRLLERYNDLETQKRVIALKQQLIELNASSTKEVAKSVENNFQQVTQEIQKSAEAVFAVYDELVKR